MGVDLRTEEQILADRANDLREMARADIEGYREQYAGEADIRRGARMLGTELGLKFGKPKLSPEEYRQIDAANTARARFETELQGSGRYLDEDGRPDNEIIAVEQQRILGEEMVRVGDSRGFALLQSSAEQRNSILNGRINRDAMYENTETTRYNRDRKRVTDYREDLEWAVGEAKQVWRRGTSDPNSGFVVYQRADGIFEDDKGQQYSAGDITMYPPQDPTGAGGGKVDVFAQRALRQKMEATAAQARGAVRMKRQLEESIDATGQVTIMDGSGRIGSAIVKTIDVAVGVAAQVEAAFAEEGVKANDILTTGTGVGKNLSSRGSAMQYANKNLSSLDSFAKDNGVWDLIPENIRQNDRARQEYYATLTQIVYARARANEPGARQLSDNDFKNAMMGLAGATNDPEAFRRVMYGNVLEDVRATKLAYGLMPDHLQKPGVILGQRGLEAWENDIDNFYREFGVQPFGALGGGPGLESGAQNPTAPGAVSGDGTEEDPYNL